jgi:hypothetical protein
MNRGTFWLVAMILDVAIIAGGVLAVTHALVELVFHAFNIPG